MKKRERVEKRRIGHRTFLPQSKRMEKFQEPWYNDFSGNWIFSWKGESAG